MDYFGPKPVQHLVERAGIAWFDRVVLIRAGFLTEDEAGLTDRRLERFAKLELVDATHGWK